MNKLAEQLSTDIAVRAAQKLAAINPAPAAAAAFAKMPRLNPAAQRQIAQSVPAGRANPILRSQPQVGAGANMPMHNMAYNPMSQQMTAPAFLAPQQMPSVAAARNQLYPTAGSGYMPMPQVNPGANVPMARQMFNPLFNKTGSFKGSMEKDAFNIPPSIANKALAGAGLGALLGVGGTMAADTLSDYDPSFMDYVRAAIDNAARGGLIGGGIGALNV